jgi:D-arabinose 1-dehydrogenase-like Zn-dependent alcohol dehydrogenase
MKVKQYYTTGNRDILQKDWDKPDITHNQIEVKSIYTGVCSSDVSMYKGQFPLLPTEMHGHEGLGEVTKIGRSIFHVEVGDIVATRGEPAFAEYYNAPVGTFVRVPEADPKYILEPVACAINLGRAAKLREQSKVCIIGTGFLAKCLYEYIVDELTVKIDVIGRSNSRYWYHEAEANLINFIDAPADNYDVVYDLSTKAEHFEQITVNENGTYVVGAEKDSEVSTNFSKFLWNNVTIKCPSPRDPHFISCMKQAEEYVKRGIIMPEDSWTHEYSSDKIDVAFAENINKKPSMGRSYIKWQ